MQKILDDLVNNVKENIPGYIAISVAEIASVNVLYQTQMFLSLTQH
ncbi:hypothetical protein PJW08_12930 [Tenacibaculum finnmarkense]|nr:hypothetical protein PJW08_12930 [Tenacibaculum finnmarkense]